MTTYHVRAVRWEHGWELHIDGEGVTQARTLATAANQVRDYLATVHDRVFDDAEIAIRVDPGGLEDEVDAARKAVADAARAQHEAAVQSRAVATALRERGVSVTDAAAILGVSRGRVSQLVAA